jgi:hypothetical protein
LNERNWSYNASQFLYKKDLISPIRADLIAYFLSAKEWHNF